MKSIVKKAKSSLVWRDCKDMVIPKTQGKLLKFKVKDHELKPFSLSFGKVPRYEGNQGENGAYFCLFWLKRDSYAALYFFLILNGNLYIMLKQYKGFANPSLHPANFFLGHNIRETLNL
jgi:hypothetical protein